MQTKCLLCGNKQKLKVMYPATITKANRQVEIWSARRSPDKIHFRIVECQRCGMIFSCPIWPAKMIAKLYSQASCSYAEQVPYAAETYWQLFKQYRHFLPKKPVVLEVGCGSGWFLEKLANKGITQVCGVEPGKGMIDQAPAWLKRRIKADVFRPEMWSKNKFDAVLCFHALDHMVSPMTFVKEAYRLLKPGGVVLVVVHDTQGISVKLWGEASPIFDIEHVYLFNKRTLNELFVRCKFIKVQVTNLINTYPLAYWLQMSGLPKALKRLLRITAQAFGGTNLPVSLPGGNIVLVAWK